LTAGTASVRTAALLRRATKVDEKWNPIRRLTAIACWSASNLLDAFASEVMPQKPKRVRTVKPKALEDIPNWWNKKAER
jgi:hypothetical protein